MAELYKRMKYLFQDKAAENGMEPREFLNLSQAELSLRLDTNLAVPNWKKGRKGKVRTSSYHMSCHCCFISTCLKLFYFWFVL